MSQLDIFSGIELPSWIAIAGILILFIYLSKRISYSIFDPWFPIVFNQILLVGLWSLLYFRRAIRPSYYYYLLAATAMFLLPFGWLRPQRFPLFTSPSERSIQYARFANLLLIMLSIYQIVFDITFIASRGIPVLYQYGSNPQIYMGGFGIVKYIHDDNRSLIPAIAVFSFFATRRKKFLLLGLFVTVYPCLLFEWGKMGLLGVLMTFWIASMFFFGPTKFLRKVSYVAIAVSLLSIFFMFTRVAATGYGGGNTLDALQTRLIETGDSTYMYFILDGQASIPHDFTFPKYIFSNVSPYLSYVSPYFVRDASGATDTIGHVVLTAAGLPTGAGYGPSPPFQIVGHMFWKNYGIAYGFLIGFILYRMKSGIGSLKEEQAILFLVIYTNIPMIAGDAAVFIYYLFSYVFVLPPVVAAILINAALPKRKIVSVAA
jgi:hypothetical protein